MEKPKFLSRFSRVRLCATPETAAHRAPPSPGFSRQEHWSGMPSSITLSGRQSKEAIYWIALAIRHSGRGRALETVNRWVVARCYKEGG